MTFVRSNNSQRQHDGLPLVSINDGFRSDGPRCGAPRRGVAAGDRRRRQRGAPRWRAPRRGRSNARIPDLRLEPASARRPGRPRVMLDDETLRDGLQSPSVRTPTIAQKIEILHLIDSLGIDTADIGLPGAGPHVVARRRAAGARNRRQQAQGARQLRGADARSATSRRSSRSCSAPACRSKSACSSARRRSASTPKAGRSTGCCAATEDAIKFAVREGLRGDVRHRGHDAGPTRDAARALRAARSAPAPGASASPTRSGTPRPGGAAAVVRFAMQVIKDVGRRRRASTGTAIAIATWR